MGVDTSKANIYWARRSHGSGINDSSKGNWFLSLQKEFIWNQENHKKHLHYSLARKKFVYYFCPFDKVLVRQDRNKEWVADWFSHITSTEPEERIYVTVGGKCWVYCIPFGEETADLVGSACDYEENE